MDEPVAGRDVLIFSLRAASISHYNPLGTMGINLLREGEFFFLSFFFCLY